MLSGCLWDTGSKSMLVCFVKYVELELRLVKESGTKRTCCCGCASTLSKQDTILRAGGPKQQPFLATLNVFELEMRDKYFAFVDKRYN